MKKIILEYIGILLGCFIVSVAFVFLINPYKLVPGGVFGTSIVLHNLFPFIQVGTFSYMISIPLLLLSYLLLGKHIGIRTLVATLVSPFFMNLLSSWAYPSEEALQALDPSLLAGGVLNLSHDLILATILGSVLVGIGEGIMIRCHATSGGSDIVAMILHKFLRFRFSNALIGVDAVVVLFGLLVIGLGLGSEGAGKHSWALSGYSLICIFLMSKTLAYVVSGSKNNKLVFIITDKAGEEMRDFILKSMDRTATCIPSTGLYAQQHKDTLLMVVRMQEVETVTTSIKDIDPMAFVIVTDAYDAYGTRWRTFPTKNELELS